MKPKNRKMLDWSRNDIEQKFGFKGRKYTDVNGALAGLATVLLCGGLFAVSSSLPDGIRDCRALALFLDRGWTPYAMTVLAVFALVSLFVKWRKLAFQKKAFSVEIIPKGASFALTSETAQDALRRLRSFVDDASHFVLFNRIERALQNFRNIGNVSDVSEMMRAQAENDESHVESSYTLLNGIVWAIPILGFIGTVIGLSGAIGRFGNVLNAGTSVESLKDGLAPVTNNLGIAFDTTFLALILAIVIQMAMTVIKKQEELFLDECRDYAHENIITRLRLSGNDTAPEAGKETDKTVDGAAGTDGGEA